MGGFWVLSLALLFVVAQARGGSVVDDGLKIWPMPGSVSHGHKSLYTSKDFHFEFKSDKGNKYNDGSGIFKDGFSRFLDVIKVSHVVDGDFSKLEHTRILQGLNVVIFFPSDDVYMSCSRILLEEKLSKEYLKKMRNPKVEVLRKSDLMKNIVKKCSTMASKAVKCPRCGYINGQWK